MRRVRLLPLQSLLCLLPVSVVACAAEPPPPPPAPAPAPVSTVVAPTSPPPPPQEDGRLPPLARAERYDLSFDVDPNQPRFSGAVRILVSIPGTTQYVVLNARGIHVTQATAQVGQELVHAATAERTSHGGKEPEELVLTFDRPLPGGEAVLQLTFDAPFSEGLTGLYRVNDGGRWYAFTQFEAADARRAFPSFDEPSQKVPFDVHVTAPKGLLAFSNMPESGRADHASPVPTTTFDFATTPPLPTYLVAFAVGDFDVRQGQTGPVPIRLITTKGKSALGTIALEDSAALIKELAGYFGIAYPYPKLDIVAVPNFAAGAMENAGLVTFREDLLLLDPAHAPLRARREEAATIAHEFAHQWFGDLVTTAWWDDIWLNEGFATWAESKMVDLYKPAYHARLESLAHLGDVMATDALRSARAVRQPVHSTGEAMEAFDGITYEKGAAVLGMLEHYLGSDVFQRGVLAYLREHSWKTATAEDLFAALSKVSGKEVGKIAAPFLDHTGVPSVAVSLDCAAKPPALGLAETAWRALGTPAPAAPPLWVIPTDLRASGEELRVLLGDASGSYPLPKCPTWVDPNVGGYGYYRYSLDEKRWSAFAAVLPKQPESTRLVFVQNLLAQVRAGTIGPDVMLRTLPALDGDESRIVRDAEIDALIKLEHLVVTPEAAPAFAKYAAARLFPHQKRLAARLNAAKGARGASDAGAALTEDDTLARQSVFTALGRLAGDPATLAEADRLAVAWLADPTKVDSDLAQVAVALGSRRAGPARVLALRAAMKGAKNPNDRQTALVALGGFDDPATLEKALALVLTDEVPTQDMLTPVWPALHRPATRAVTMRWLMAHWDAVKARLPTDWAGDVFEVAGLACTKAEIAEARAFLTPRAAEVEGSARPLAEGLESAEVCATLRDAESGAVDAFFKVKRK